MEGNFNSLLLRSLTLCYSAKNRYNDCPMTAKKPVTCKKCCLCRGNRGPARDIYEFAHGVNRTNHDWWEA